MSDRFNLSFEDGDSSLQNNQPEQRDYSVMKTLFQRHKDKKSETGLKLVYPADEYRY